MAVVYNTTVKNSRLDTVTTAVDAGAGPGYIEVGTASMAAVLVTIDLKGTSAPAASGGVLTFNTSPDLEGIAASTGVAVEARIKDGDGTVIVSGLTVGTSGTDITLNSTSIVTGATVTIQTASITHG